MEHTELPWTATDAPDVGILIEAGRELIAVVDSECADIATCDVGPANANLIVRAVNNHAKLLAALEGLTEIGRTADGGIIVGPQGWTQTRDVIEEAKK